MTIRQSDILCCYDFDTTIIGSDGLLYLKDFGPNECHLPLEGAGAPNPPTRQTDGSYQFDGINDYLQMTSEGATRFWDCIEDEHTDYCFIAKAYYNNPAVNDTLFGSRISYRIRAASAERLNVTSATANNAGDGSDVPLTKRTHISVHGLRYRSAAIPLGYWRHYPGLRTDYYSSGAGIPTLLRTIRPTVGAYITPANYFDGKIYYLAHIRILPAADDVIQLHRDLEDGRKPWCNQ